MHSPKPFGYSNVERHLTSPSGIRMKSMAPIRGSVKALLHGSYRVISLVK